VVFIINCDFASIIASKKISKILWNMIWNSDEFYGILLIDLIILLKIFIYIIIKCLLYLIL